MTEASSFVRHSSSAGSRSGRSRSSFWKHRRISSSPNESSDAAIAFASTWRMRAARFASGCGVDVALRLDMAQAAVGSTQGFEKATGIQNCSMP